jgi:hypothetical protein
MTERLDLDAFDAEADAILAQYGTGEAAEVQSTPESNDAEPFPELIVASQRRQANRVLLVRFGIRPLL